MYFYFYFLLCFSKYIHAFEDSRCKCICADYKSKTTGDNPLRSVHIKITSPDKCNCNAVLDKDSDLCPYCDCKYQVRNSMTIKVVICLIITVLAALMVYLIFVTALEPLLTPNTRLLFAKSILPLIRGTPKASSNGIQPTATVPIMPAVEKSARDAILERHYSTGSYDALSETNVLGPVEFNRYNDSLTFLSVVDETVTPDVPIDLVSEMVHRAKEKRNRWKGSLEIQRERVFSERMILN